MYIKDDVCYAGELQDDIKIVEAKPLRSGMMLVTFSTGEQRLFDTKVRRSSRLPMTMYSAIPYSFMA